MKMKQDISARRGRPKSREKRQQIQAAAAQLFIREGFERTSMDSIAAEARVSKQTVYSHFESKEQLFRNCIIGKVDEHQLLLEKSAALDLEAGLKRLARGYLDLISDDRAMSMWRLLIGSASSHQPMASAFYDSGPGATLDSLSRFLRAHRDELATDDFDEAADTFVALVLGPHQAKIMLGLSPGVPADKRPHFVSRAVRQFLGLYRREAD